MVTLCTGGLGKAFATNVCPDSCTRCYYSLLDMTRFALGALCLSLAISKSSMSTNASPARATRRPRDQVARSEPENPACPPNLGLEAVARHLEMCQEIARAADIRQRHDHLASRRPGRITPGRARGQVGGAMTRRRIARSRHSNTID